MGKMTFDSLLSELRNMRREQQKGLAWDCVGLAFYLVCSLSFAVVSFKTFELAAREDGLGFAVRWFLFCGSLGVGYKSFKFLENLVSSVDRDNFGTHLKNLRKIAKVEKRFKIYKRAFEIKEERRGKD